MKPRRSDIIVGAAFLLLAAGAFLLPPRPASRHADVRPAPQIGKRQPYRKPKKGEPVARITYVFEDTLANLQAGTETSKFQDGAYPDNGGGATYETTAPDMSVLFDFGDPGITMSHFDLTCRHGIFNSVHYTVSVWDGAEWSQVGSGDFTEASDWEPLETNYPQPAEEYRYWRVSFQSGGNVDISDVRPMIGSTEQFESGGGPPPATARRRGGGVSIH